MDLVAISDGCGGGSTVVSLCVRVLVFHPLVHFDRCLGDGFLAGASSLGILLSSRESTICKDLPDLDRCFGLLLWWWIWRIFAVEIVVGFNWHGGGK